MAQQTPQRDRAREVRISGVFIARSNIPQVAIRIIGKWRLKEMIADLDKLTVRVNAGANDKGDFLLAGFTLALKFLNYARGIGTNRKSGSREAVLEGPFGLRSDPAERVGHRRLLVAQHFFCMAVRTPRISGERRNGKSQRHPDPYCF